MPNIAPPEDLIIIIHSFVCPVTPPRRLGLKGTNFRVCNWDEIVNNRFRIILKGPCCLSIGRMLCKKYPSAKGRRAPFHAC